jgi:hypothetical protein
MASKGDDMRQSLRILAFVVTVIASNSSVAAPCAGFTDVDATSPFCANVEWLKNRGITLGCTSAMFFCPGDPVSRVAMAAFMSRLGNALEPAFVHAAQFSAQAVVNADGVVCKTAPFTANGYPRVATASAMLYHYALNSKLVSTQLVYSLDGGTSWSNFGDLLTVAANVAASFVSQSPVAKPVFIAPGQTVVFGINASGAEILDAGCELTVRIDNRSGTSSPYDGAAPASAQVLMQPARR